MAGGVTAGVRPACNRQCDSSMLADRNVFVLAVVFTGVKSKSLSAVQLQVLWILTRRNPKDLEESPAYYLEKLVIINV